MTNRELAKKIGVSPATLSLVINKKPGISDSMRSRVLAKIEEYGLTDMLRSDTESPATAGNNICFVVYKRHGGILDQSPFFLYIMEGVESRAHKYGYNLLFLSIDRRNPMEEQIARLMSMDCKGIVIFATEMLEDDVAFFADLPFPYVLLDNDFPRMNLDSVAINNTLGTYQAVEHLVGLGHTRIGYLKSRIFINSFGERDAGFFDVMRHFGLSLDKRNIYELDFSEEGSYQEFKRMLATSRSLPTAFVTDDDTIASGAIKALAEIGITIPDNISIVGFDDRPLCELCEPKLSSIRVPKYVFGAMAIDLLVKRIDDPCVKGDDIRSFKYRIGTELMIRSSVRRLDGE